MYVKNTLPVDVKNVQLIDAQMCSDHDAVLVDLEIQNTEY